MNEFELIRKFFANSAGTESVVLGVGDDCAVLTPPRGQMLVVSIDTQVEGRHFPEGAPGNLVASRALRCAISDLAAMGAEPHWFTLALTLPEVQEEWLASFSEGLFKTADTYNIALVGGDTTRGPLTITIQVHGSAPEKNLLLRSKAAVGDEVFVTSTLGDARAGLEVVRGDLNVDERTREYFTQRYWSPEARIRAGLLLRYMASSCIDISDGLLADLKHICDASGVGVALDSSKLPLSAELLASVPTRTALEWALAGGDDYQLCFTAAPEHTEQLLAQSRTGALAVTRIGEVVEGSGVYDDKTGKAYNLASSGYVHF